MLQLSTSSTTRVLSILLVSAAAFSSACRSRSLSGLENRDVAIGQGSGLPSVESNFPETACVANQVRCEGASLQRCAADGSSFATVETCASASLCDAGSETCGAANCLTDEMTCRDNVLLVCNAERTDFEVFSTCESAAHCSASERRCLQAPCTGGSLRCNRQDDSSAALERCNDELPAWDFVDTCLTRQLCDQTVLSVGTGSLMLNSDGVIGEGEAQSTETVTCLAAACQPGQVQCDGANFMACNEGLTDFELVEVCGSAQLCEQSIESGGGAAAGCELPICDAGTFRCSESGALEQCDESRTAFRLIQQCIGAAFCDAGAGTCNDAPCEPSAESCNSAQPQRCRQDQSAFDPIGDPCVTAALCNDETDSAFCEEPACGRDGLNGDEFQCTGAILARCNESFTGYDEVETCPTAELCDAPSGQCSPAVCEAGEHRCDGGVLELCNAGLTGFDSLENCGDPSQCDATAGACTDPCEPGSSRCTPQGEIEQCQDRLTGWQTTADCLTPQLCDAAGPSCITPVCQAGEIRCRADGQDSVLEQCRTGQDGYDALETCNANQICDAASVQCDDCSAGSVSCDGDTLVSCSNDGQNESRQQCGQGLCSADAGRCLVCDPIGSARCTGLQLLVCQQGPQGEFEASQDCDTPALCQDTLQGCSGGNCQCRDGICGPGQVSCNGNQLVQCNAGLNGFNTLNTCDPGLCNAQQQRCDECSGNGATCTSGNSRRVCRNGLFSDENCNNGQICNNGQCIQSACNRGDFNCFGNALQSCNADRTAFDFEENCPQGLCNAQSARCDVCGAGQRRCTGGVFLEECNPQRTGFNRVTACTAGGCNDSTLQCNECANQLPDSCINGRNTLRSCQNNRFVDRNCGNGSTCRGDRCVVNECNPATFQTTCSGQTARLTCNGGEFLTLNCPNGQRCEGGQCVRPTCQRGERRCTGGVFLEECNAGQTGFEQVTICSVAGCNATTLQCNECLNQQPPLCIGGANLLRTCQNNRLIERSCGANATCRLGACVANECNANTFLACQDVSTRRICSQGEIIPVNCLPSQFCRLGACEADNCTGGSFRCSPGDARRIDRCNTSGSGFEFSERCGVGETCQGGTSPRCAGPPVVR